MQIQHYYYELITIHNVDNVMQMLIIALSKSPLINFLCNNAIIILLVLQCHNNNYYYDIVCVNALLRTDEHL